MGPSASVACPRRQYLLKVQARPFRRTRNARVDVRAGSVDDVRVVLVQGTPLVVHLSDERWHLVRFTLFDARGERASQQALLTRAAQNPDEPGRYELEVRTGGASEVRAEN